MARARSTDKETTVATISPDLLDAQSSPRRATRATRSAMAHASSAQFTDVIPFVLQWIVPDMRHTKHEAMLVYETLSYTLATFSLLERRQFEIVRFRNVTISRTKARSSLLWNQINYEIGKIHRVAWQRYLRTGAHVHQRQSNRERPRPARRKVLRDHLWTRGAEEESEIFWEHTMILRKRWKPDFALNPERRSMYEHAPYKCYWPDREHTRDT